MDVGHLMESGDFKEEVHYSVTEKGGTPPA